VGTRVVLARLRIYWCRGLDEGLTSRVKHRLLLYRHGDNIFRYSRELRIVVSIADYEHKTFGGFTSRLNNEPCLSLSGTTVSMCMYD
jgi:hypothetical protein